MKFRLGYVDGPLSINAKMHTITYSSYKKLKEKEGSEKLSKIIDQNLNTLLEILKFNKDNDICFYRMSHTIIPLATIKEINLDYIKPYIKKWKEIGTYIKKSNMRVDIHPNQYCILNSNNKEITKNSIEILKFNYSLFKAMNIESKIILHVGGKYENKEKSIARFKHNFSKLDQCLKEIIILENDDKIYNITDILQICEELNIPMVLDYHHYLCNNNKEKLQDYIPRIINTWKYTKLPPKIHFSSPKSKKDFRSHSVFIDYKNFIKMLNIFKNYTSSLDIMLECKGKDEALFLLSKKLKYTENIKFINNSTFEII